MSNFLTPLEQERREFGYNLVDLNGKPLRIVHLSRSSKSPGIRNGEEIKDDRRQRCVFFVHGGGGRACQFKHQLRALAEDADVVAIDFLGHGDSPAPNDPLLYTADEHLASLVDLYKHFKKEENIIVSHCHGCVHTLRLVNGLSDEEKRGLVGVVLMNIGRKSPVSPGIGLKLPASILEYARPFLRSSSNAALFTPQTNPDLIKFENSISDNNRMYVMKAIATDCSDQERWDSWLANAQEDFTNIRTMMIVGEQDGVFQIEESHKVQESLKIEESQFHVISSSGHLPMLEKPSQVSELIQNFIRSL